MTIEELMNIANEQNNKRHVAVRSPKVTGDVMITEKPACGVHRARVNITVYNEPSKCHFRNTEYWAPVFDERKSRLYLIYGKKGFGYKSVRGGTKTIGIISATNDCLLDYMHKYKLFDQVKHRQFRTNWKWDADCNRPYVDLSENAINLI